VIALIAAVAENGVIGADGAIPWHLPADFAHFKQTTMGQTLVMGRATYDSIGRPLPGRTTIVLTRSPSWSAPGVQTASSIEEALSLATTDVYVAGGATVYEQAMAYADVQLLSEVPLSPPGDTHYPAIDPAVWHVTRRDPHEGFVVVRWERLG
jgi:dihydrofolate reductase